MITLRFASQQTKVMQAIAAREGLFPKLILLLDGVDLSGRLAFQESGTWGQSEIPITLDFSIAGILGRRFQDAKCELFVEIDGVVIPQMTGWVTTPSPGGSGGSGESGGGTASMISPSQRVGTELISASAGSLLPRTTLDAFTEYRGNTPEFIARDAVYRVGVYDRGQIRIDPLETPILEFVADTGFTAQETCSDVLSRLVDTNTSATTGAITAIQKVPYLFRDTALNGFRAQIDKGLGSRDWIHSYQANEIPDWIPPQRKTERYSQVIVFRENPEATTTTPGEDRYAIFESAEINYTRPIRPPFAHTTLYIPFEDTSADGPRLARNLAYSQATIHGRGIYQVNVSLPSFDPLIERGDVHRVDEVHRDDDGLWERAWLMAVDGFTHNFSAESLGTEVSASAVIIEEEQIRAPAFINPSALDFAKRPTHEESAEEIIFYDLPGVSEEGDEVVFSEDMREVYEDGDELVVLMPTTDPKGLSTGVVKMIYGEEDGELYFTIDCPFVDVDGGELVFFESSETSIDNEMVVIR